METHQIEKLREDRANVFSQMQELAGSAEDRDFTAEEQDKWNDLNEAFDSLGKRIEREERLKGIAPKMTASDVLDEPNQVDSEEFAAKRDEAFSLYMRDPKAGREAFAALQVGTDSEGGYAVGETWANELIESAREFGVIRSLATVIRTSDGSPIHYPTIATFPTAALTAEEASYTESEPTFGEKVLGAYKYGVIAKVSDELRQDALFDIDALVQRLSGQAITIAEDAKFVAGTGSSQPQGAAVGASAGVTAASATAITAAELVDLYHSLLSPYRANASWVLKDSTALLVRKLADSTGQYLWQPGLQAGMPDTLLGRPVYTDTNVAAAATGNISVLFGDFKRGYVVREAGGVTVKVLEELYAATGQVGYRVDRRSDGAVVDSSAIKKLTQA